MKKGKIIATALLSVACAFAFAACDGEKEKEPTTTPPAAEQPTYAVSISGAPTESVLLSQGGCTLTAAGELPKNAELIWASSDATVASVDQNGAVTYLKGGMAVISVSVKGYDDLTARFTLTVVDDSVIEATGVAFADGLPSSVPYETGVTYLTASLLPEGAQAEEMEYISSDPTVAKVDGAGMVTLLSTGEVTFTVRLKSDPTIKDEHTLTVTAADMENTDGTFDGTKGEISLYGATSEQITADIKWANTTAFSLVKDEALLPDGGSGNALRVTSQGAREWSFLFIRFGNELKKGRTYEITFNAKWLGEADADGFYYSIDDETQTQTEMASVAKYAPLALSDVFKENATFTFVADQDYEYFYFRLITNSLEDENDPVFFDFTIDDIKLTELPLTAIENTDGGFDGTEGVISLYTPHDPHITAGVTWGSRTALEYVADPSLLPDGGSGNAIRVTSDISHSWSFLFIRFNTPLKSGRGYEINFDGKWFGGATAEGFHYSIDDDKQAQTTIAGTGFYAAIARADLFKENASIVFKADKDYQNGFYLRLITNSNGSETDRVAFDFTIDNITLTALPLTALENTDGAFDGTAGKISLYSPLDTHITAEVKWGSPTTFTETSDPTLIPAGGSGNAVRVTSSKADVWGFVFIHFDFALVAGETYQITFDAKWLGNSTANCFYYSIDDDKQTQWTASYQQMERAKLFKENAVIEFTADKDYQNGFYLRLIENDTADVTLDFTIDNIAIVKKEN